jgi:endonuclease V-like protein UPF0215 family
VLGIDDAPFRKGQDGEVPLVGVVMAGTTQVEGVTIRTFPVDGDGATGFLADWIGALRWSEVLQALLLGGVSIAGLGLVDLEDLTTRLGFPVLAVTRREPRPDALAHALRTAGVPERVPLLDRLPPARRWGEGIWLASAGTDDEDADAILRASIGRARLPEPLRIAHLIGAALVMGESKGRA